MGNRWLTMAIFLAVVVGVMGGVHWLLWARFARDPAFTPPSLSFITTNALFAAEGLVIPVPMAMMDYASATQFFSLLTGSGAETKVGESAPIERLREQGVTVLLVEQDVSLALSMASHATILENGEVSLQGETAALMHDPAVRRAYLGM